MMKRKFLAVTIPVVGCITVVGAGFSAWYFSDVLPGAENSTLNIHVTEKVDSMEGALKISQTNIGDVLEDKYLILDQGGFKNNDPLFGIMIADSVGNETVKDDRTYSFKVKFDGTGLSGLTLNKLYDANMELSVTVEIDLSNKLFQYVTLVDDVSMKVSYPQTSGLPDETATFTDDNSDNKWTATYTLDAEIHSELFDKDISQFEWTFEIDLSTSADLKNSLFRYKDNKPTSVSTYNDMLDALGLGVEGTPGTLGFTTTAKIGAVA